MTRRSAVHFWRLRFRLCALATLTACAPVHVAELPPAGGETVVLLHGLARSAASMRRMERSLEQAGYHVCNIEYPSRSHGIAALAHDHVAPRIAACSPSTNEPIHFVTHSLGGISLIIPGDDDGKVSVRNARLEGMRDFASVKAAHPFLMNDRDAIAMTLRFLARGCFACGGTGAGSPRT